MRERRPRTALTMLSMCISICGRSGSPPRTQRMQVAPKIWEIFNARVTWASSVPSWALNDRELGQTEPCASCSLIPSWSACARTCRIAASSSSIAAGREIIAHVSLIELEVVEKLRRREVVAADAAVNRSELDTGRLPREQPRGVKRPRPRSPARTCVDPWRSSGDACVRTIVARYRSPSELSGPDCAQLLRAHGPTAGRRRFDEPRRGPPRSTIGEGFCACSAKGGAANRTRNAVLGA